MQELNPTYFRDRLDETLRRYLATALPISPRYPRLRAEFSRLLERETLVRGPYVESLPDFEKGETLRGLLNEGVLQTSWQRLTPDLLDRPLHRHQERALRLALQDQASFVVATGTGSGKTECFLFPAIDRLLRDPERASPGVRILVIYPLNALANDQLYFRLAPLLLRDLEGTGITFGRFTSAIAANRRRDEVERELLESDALSEALGHPDAIDMSWRLTREEMLARPPHIQITNYAMLEHLLLLPRNAPLFADSPLHTIVLDEIHTYAGTQAIEVAYLLRKLRNRLRPPHPIQCIGTSASLGEGADAEAKTKLFASDLFGAEVTEVVRGRRLTHRGFREVPATFELAPSAWAQLKEACRAFHDELPEDSNDAARRALWTELTEGIPGLPPCSEDIQPFRAVMLALFAGNAEMRKAATALERQMLTFDELAEQVFGEGAEASDALAGLIAVGILCRSSDKEFPLLPARYHLALSGIEGVYLSLDRAQPECWAALEGKRLAGAPDQLFWPLLTCRNCGQPYVEAYYNGEMLTPRRETERAERKVLWLGEPDRLLSTDEAGGDDGDGPDDAASEDWFSFCPRTGQLTAPDDAGAISLVAVPLERDEEEQRLYVEKRRCPACGYVERRFAEPIAPLRPGDEPLAAVAAQLLLEALPPPVVRQQRLRPMDGRKLLVFSDNRQDAAFFAPSFERTSRDLALRTAIYQAVDRGEGEALELGGLTDEVYGILTGDDARQGLFWDPAGREVLDRVRAKKELAGRIVAEFCGFGGRRISLESLGLVTVSYESRGWESLLGQLRRELPDAVAEHAAPLALLLLEHFRERRAISDVPSVDFDNDSLWGAHAGRRSFVRSAEKVGDCGSFWLPSPNNPRGNKRTRLLEVAFKLDHATARAVLETFWKWAQHRQVALITAAGTFGGNRGFVLDLQKIGLRAASGLPLYRCAGCGLQQLVSVNDVCAADRCGGRLEAVAESERRDLNQANHYVRTYREGQALIGLAREHTAAIATEAREKIEDRFREGNINLLSCTTTMELGVDLGDLEAAFNANVPPGIANYQQRTGRAGRRAQAAPVVLTLARGGNYDQAAFRDFDTYLANTPRPPFVKLDNEPFFSRHQLSILLGHFLRHVLGADARNAPRLVDLLGNPVDDAMFSRVRDTLGAWLESEAGTAALAEAEGLCATLPPDRRHVGRRGSELTQRFLIRIGRFLEVHAARLGDLCRRMAEAKEADQFGLAERLQRDMKRYLDQFLVDLFVRVGLIPTYSFPVDDVKLEVLSRPDQRGKDRAFQARSDELDLTRDAAYAIAEYAPGAEVVAGGRVWTSAGIARYSGEFEAERPYHLCKTCNHPEIRDFDDQLPSTCTNCGEELPRTTATYLQPKGFVTSAAEPDGRDPGAGRIRARSIDEARLVTSAPHAAFTESGVSGVSLAFLPASPEAEGGTSPGELFVVNRGPKGWGYWRCRRCEYAAAATAPKNLQGPKAKHRNPRSGTECSSTALNWPVHLGHLFRTDVRQIRLGRPLPASEVGTDREDTREAFVRTLVEAIRLTAAELLAVDLRELRATWMVHGASPDIVLYDGVTGGAGYAHRIGGEISARRLLEKTRERLDCECAAACRKCLFDYTNQRHWDALDRGPVLVWLEELLREAGSGDALATLGAAPWTTPSLSGLRERLAGTAEVLLYAPRWLEADEGADPTARDFVVDLLRSGKRVYVGSAEKLPSFGTQSSELRELLEHFGPWLRNGSLRLFTGPRPALLAERFQARVMAERKRAWLVGDSEPPLFTSVLPGEVAELPLDGAGPGAEITAWLRSWQAVDVAPLLSQGEVRFRSYKSGEPRDLGFWFGSLANGSIDRLRVRDPYALNSERNRRSLARFLGEFSKVAGGWPPVIEILFMDPDELQHGDSLSASQQDAALKRDLQAWQKPAGVHLRSMPIRRTRQKDFHDRELVVEVIDGDGRRRAHRYALSGGVDRFLDMRYECAVTHTFGSGEAS